MIRKSNINILLLIILTLLVACKKKDDPIIPQEKVIDPLDIERGKHALEALSSGYWTITYKFGNNIFEFDFADDQKSGSRKITNGIKDSKITSEDYESFTVNDLYQFYFLYTGSYWQVSEHKDDNITFKRIIDDEVSNEVIVYTKIGETQSKEALVILYLTTPYLANAYWTNDDTNLYQYTINDQKNKISRDHYMIEHDMIVFKSSKDFAFSEGTDLVDQDTKQTFRITTVTHQDLVLTQLQADGTLSTKSTFRQYQAN